MYHAAPHCPPQCLQAAKVCICIYIYVCMPTNICQYKRPDLTVEAVFKGTRVGVCMCVTGGKITPCHVDHPLHHSLKMYVYAYARMCVCITGKTYVCAMVMSLTHLLYVNIYHTHNKNLDMTLLTLCVE